MSVISLEEWRKRLGLTSISRSPSNPNLPSETTGQKLTKEQEDQLEEKTKEAVEGLCFIIYQAWTYPFTTRSRLAREYAELVAIAATEGLITTMLEEGKWGRFWLATDFGIKYLKENENYEGTD